ncbi:2-phospho-L-lactate guanylyltransferase [Haloglomus halophilum]|uniref:2-phospho-L-lactate guanylyltransferase n=1 Tax=Haloglomus halophilum TaxID=2962672 RepID=UPI0020C9D75E|nr:2-phospho-L-lactate guanylyltransferase [Haloglomus halophilum]
MTDADPHVLVPFDPSAPKTRLAPLFDERERRAFAAAMLEDVLATLEALDLPYTVLSKTAHDAVLERSAAVVVDDRPLTTAVNARLAGDLVGEAEPPVPSRERPVAVVMADLPLVTPDALGRLLFAEVDGRHPDVTMAPGLGGGTNALCVRDGSFRVDYHGASCRDHREAARERGLDLATVDSFRLASDIDERADLVEVLLHGEGTETRRYLRNAGFSLTTGDGRVRVARGGDGSA